MARRSRIVIGLNSGTSVDGVDAVACEIAGTGPNMRVRVLGHLAIRYPAALRERLLNVMAPARTTTEELCRLHTAVGRAFASAARWAVARLGLSRVDFVGSHGQTICHLPPGGDARDAKRSGRSVLAKASGRESGLTGGAGGARETGTLQIGDASIIAAELGVPVVSQFRQGDMAVGGQGAPLVPWTDYVLFRDAKKSRVIQNIGGIANLTWLPAGGGEGVVIAFDCGPGNMIIDALVHRFTGGEKRYDRNGSMATKGSVLSGVLAAMLAHPFVARRPPKSCGREEFGERYVEALLSRYSSKAPTRGGRVSPEDWVRTATRFTAECIARAYASLVGSPKANADAGAEAGAGEKLRGGSRGRTGTAAKSGRKIGQGGPGREASNRIDEIVLCGGGAKNKMLLVELASAMQRQGIPGALQLTPMDAFGISAQAKECVSFAMLAAARMDGVAANLPGVTGARRRVVLGNVTI